MGVNQRWYEIKIRVTPDAGGPEIAMRTVAPSEGLCELPREEWNVPEGYWIRRTRFTKVVFKGLDRCRFWFEAPSGELGFYVEANGNSVDDVPSSMIVEYGFVEEMPFSMN